MVGMAKSTPMSVPGAFGLLRKVLWLLGMQASRVVSVYLVGFDVSIFIPDRIVKIFFVQFGGIMWIDMPK